MIPHGAPTTKFSTRWHSCATRSRGARLTSSAPSAAIIVDTSTVSRRRDALAFGHGGADEDGAATARLQSVARLRLVRKHTQHPDHIRSPLAVCRGGARSRHAGRRAVAATAVHRKEVRHRHYERRTATTCVAAKRGCTNLRIFGLIRCRVHLQRNQSCLSRASAAQASQSSRQCRPSHRGGQAREKRQSAPPDRTGAPQSSRSGHSLALPLHQGRPKGRGRRQGSWLVGD